MDTQKRVLLVDDEEGVRHSWDRFLSGAGFAVSTAETGEHAIARLQTEPVDVVVSDLQMPGINGVELLEWMQDRRPETPFILITGYGNEEVKRRVRELGGFGYLDKPISPEALSAVITAALLREQAAEKRRKDLEEAAEQARIRILEAIPPELGAAPARTRDARTEARTVELAEAVNELEGAPTTETTPGRGKIRTGLEVAGWLVAAPILGLAFVVFLPVIGFGALVWTVGEAVVKPTTTERT
ncbi:MAG: response regulator [Gemmatimonadales bacterium]|nr:MAG: response regulator [Gemmatimonadales bacterium]